MDDSRDFSDLSPWEPHIRSFVAFCPPDAQAAPSSGPLRGLTVGVKDIIDVAGLPTRNGSAACEGAAPAEADAPVVASLRQAGARIVGKTTTTEFAFTDPTACRNPHDLTRTPGGSSSGSGAAVAAGLVDLALGTQTAGSLCRPAAYCGVVGVKPTYGVLPVDGMTPLARSFDTVGIIARDVAVARSAFSVLAPNAAETADPLRSTRLLLPTQTRATQETHAAWQDAADAMGAAREVVPEIDVAAIVAAHRCVMQAEAAKTHAALLHPDRIGLLQPKFRAGLEAGATLSPGEVAEARNTLDAARMAFCRQMQEVDVILTLPVPDGAPLIDGTTGFQDWLTPWTVFGGPLVSLPWGLDSLGRPRAVMLAGHPGDDLRLLSVAASLESKAPPIPRPQPPGA